jgi:hypothetical protein
VRMLTVILLRSFIFSNLLGSHAAGTEVRGRTDAALSRPQPGHENRRQDDSQRMRSRMRILPRQTRKM